MQSRLLDEINDAIAVITQLKQPFAVQFIQSVAQLLFACFQQNKKVLIAGNGGSLCDACHFAEELTGFFRQKRRPFPVIALADPAHITCVANDVGFEWIFSRAIEAYGQAGDVFIGLSTSGNSPNLIHAFKEAKQRQLHTIAFLGKEGGKLKQQADEELCIIGPYFSDRIQEAHMTALHLIINELEQLFFSL